MKLYKVFKMPLKNYIIFYTVDDTEKEVHVLRVIHSSREWQNLI